MKKILSIIFCLILLAGCNKKSSEVIAVTTGLSFTAEVSFYDTKATYNIKISENGETELESVSGNTKDMKVILKGENLNITFKELNYTSNLNSLPEGTFAKFIHTVFLDCNKKTVYFENNQYFTEGKTPEYNYKIYFGATGLPIKIEEKNQNITAFFKNTSIIESF